MEHYFAEEQLFNGQRGLSADERRHLVWL